MPTWFIAHPWLRWMAIVTLVAVLLITLGVIVLGQTAGAAPPQPVAFSHEKHVDAGAQCVFCHPGVLNGPVAGLPSVVKCMGCHQNIEVTEEEDQPDVDMLIQIWEEGQPLRWPKVNDQPDFVYFSHRPHVVAGVSCETCHGDVSHMGVAQPAYNINMGFCLNCHRQQDREKIERLVDCQTCHK